MLGFPFGGVGCTMSSWGVEDGNRIKEVLSKSSIASWESRAVAGHMLHIVPRRKLLPIL